MPCVGVACDNRVKPMMPTRAAHIAVPMNSRIFVRLTGTPTLRAALASPPDAKIQFPNVVRVRTHVAMTVSPIHHRTEVSNPGAGDDVKWLPKAERALSKPGGGALGLMP